MSTNYDVFNGDADGILALLQLQLANPTNSVKITGVKRDISLLQQVTAVAGDNIRVLDVSMEKNIDALNKVLSAGANVLYVDHHRSGDIPVRDNLAAHIDLDANTCTSLIVSELLERRFHLWAITAAYGDNLVAKADQEAEELGLNYQQKSLLKALGVYINYNGYGSDISDLHYHPAELLALLLAYQSPFELLAQSDSVFTRLETAYRDDMSNAENAEVLFDSEQVKVLRLADAAWARRVSGVLGNALANQSPGKAHAVLTHHKASGYTISVRAPLTNKQGADAVCIQFSTGGGRAGAAGVNQLPDDKVTDFIDAINRQYEG